MKNVLVIGSQGYLGSRLTDYLKKKDCRCTGVDTGFFKLVCGSKRISAA